MVHFLKTSRSKLKTLDGETKKKKIYDHSSKLECNTHNRYIHSCYTCLCSINDEVNIQK